ncbi:MAG: TIGR00730 family Rossman fold protein [Saprospiraceae bacterium]|nr:MAG: TIGR00730 family Rossman fold protein [Saprospiraceae bacterium]
MKSICVFCGSSAGSNPIYAETAHRLGVLFAQRQIRLVYGGGNVGLMGVAADACLGAGGSVLGVIPGFLKEKEVCHTGLTELIVTRTMHERKQIMEERSDGFIMLPGGYGTLDEFFEILTWRQLHLHSKPTGLLNVDGYYCALLAHVQRMSEDGFLKKANLSLIVVADEIEELLEKMEQPLNPSTPKWL